MRIKSLLQFTGILAIVSLQFCTPVKETTPPEVEITDQFWNRCLETNRLVSIPRMLDDYEGRGSAPSSKLVEAVGFVLANHPDPDLEAYIDGLSDDIIESVLPDGKPRKWDRLLNGQLYQAGHFMEAAVAWYEGTGNRKMLDAAIMVANDIDANFGPGKRLEISQHEEVKIGLLKLYRVTGDEKYLDLARFFLDERGHSSDGRKLYGEYAQDHKPVIEQEEVVGHTVRATYLYTPLAELADITGNSDYNSAAGNIWEDMVFRKIYINGHVGPYRDHESFGDAYELPNVNCWNETCAAIGNVFFHQRLFNAHRDAKYADVMERILYNAVLPSVSLDGEKYFYQNPLRTFGETERHHWFGPNCCPPNIVRMFASLGDYIYARDGSDIYVNLFVGSTAKIESGGQLIEISQDTEYPWEGAVTITVAPESPVRFPLYVRIPGWARNQPVPGDLYSYMNESDIPVVLKVNGREVSYSLDKGYVRLDRKWEQGDRIELDFPMSVRRVLAHEKVLDNVGMVALERGPLVYCVEGLDNEGNVMNLYVPDDARFTAEYMPGKLGGIVTISGTIEALGRGADQTSVVSKDIEMTAIPYYAWANRGPGEMSVWLAREPSRTVIPPVPTIASRSRVTSSVGKGTIEDNYPGQVPTVARRFYPNSQSGSTGFEALYDQVTPVNSFDGSSVYFRMRPESGNTAWVQYDFDAVQEISSSEVYWKDDKQYCSAPASWRLLYRSGDRWLPVSNPTPYTVEKDRFNSVRFEPVRTNGIRMEITLNGLDYAQGELGPPDGNYLPDDTTWYECGIIEWQVE